MEKKSKIIIYDPEVIFWGVAAGFHGYAIAFIKEYADYIYINKRLRTQLKYRQQLWKLGVRRNIPFIHSLKNTDAADKLIGFVIPGEDDENINDFKGEKIFHLMDYYLFVARNKEFLEKYGVDRVIGHTQMDVNCEFFKKYYPQYVGKVISLPFGYQCRFKCNRSFDDRKNIAVGLGSINPTDDPLLDKEAKKELVEFYSDKQFMHPLRRYIQTHDKEFCDVIETKFPTPDKQKDFSYDAVEMLNRYKMFLNDAGLSNFPPARTYEGIACGCVMVAEQNSIYDQIGFIPDVNYIAYEKDNYEHLKEKIKYYQMHSEELRRIHLRSMELSKNYTHDKIADNLYQMIEKNVCD